MTKGILITQQGVDVSQAQDSQKVLDTRWKAFEIEREVVFTMPVLIQSSGVQEIYKHDLGFLPAFDIYDTVLDSYVQASTAQGAGCISDTQRIGFQSFYTDDGWSGHKCILRIYNLDPTVEFQAPIVQTLPSVGSSNQLIGIKIVRDTSEMTESELSRFSMDTKGKALQIQRTGVTIADSTTGFLAVIQHNLGYPPTYLMTYVDAKHQWIGAIDPDFLPAFGNADGVNLTFHGVQSTLNGSFAYIVFKELGDFAI